MILEEKENEEVITLAMFRLFLVEMIKKRPVLYFPSVPVRMK